MFNIRSSRQYLGLWIFTVFIFVVSCKKLDLKREIAVKTSGIQLNQDNSVTADGTILDIGDGSIIDHGHCWALTSKPNPTNNYTALGPLSVVGDFESVLPPLGSGTWYIRAYVSVDTDPGPTYIYGAEMEITVSGYACGTALTDTRDGKSYTTIQIGTQCWMAANLNLGSFINSNGPSGKSVV